MKVALVHDWLIHMRGGEKVLEAIAEVFPDASIHTLFSDRERLSPTLRKMRIRNSVLQHLPGIRLYYRWLLPLLPFFIRTLRIEKVDLVLSSSHCVAKGVRVPRGSFHICYCHTPMRYLWGFEEEYFGTFPRWFQRFLDPFFDRLRKWDVETSRKVDAFLCNSENVRKRIEAVYGREAEVIPPPVDTSVYDVPLPPPSSLRQKGRQEAEDYYLIVSALTPYKRIDIAVEAFNHWDRNLVIAGNGPSKSRYERLVRTPRIRFLGKVSDIDLKRLYSEARALIFPQVEDFGIVPLEAQACGTPVIAYGKGGALETVRDGVFFYEQTPKALKQAIVKFESMRFDRDALRTQALKFDKKVFQHKIRQQIEKCLLYKNAPNRSF